jgi:hypothetical protein
MVCSSFVNFKVQNVEGRSKKIWKFIKRNRSKKNNSFKLEKSGFEGKHRRLKDLCKPCLSRTVPKRYEIFWQAQNEARATVRRTGSRLPPAAMLNRKRTQFNPELPVKYACSPLFTGAGSYKIDSKCKIHLHPRPANQAT